MVSKAGGAVVESFETEYLESLGFGKKEETLNQIAADIALAVDATRRADHAERARNTAVREATEGFIRVNESYRVLEENAEAFEVDLLRSAQVMRAMDTARAEREDSATASLLRRAREKRLEAEAEERAFEAARRVVRRGGKK